MDTRQLAAFCAVVEKQSFSQAAERLGVTQPAVSLQIRALEERLGRRLLDRSGRRVEPTEAGLALYRDAQRMLQVEQQLIEELAQRGDGRAARHAGDRRLDRPRRAPRAAAALRVPARAPEPRGRAVDLRHATGDRAGRRARARAGRGGRAPPAPLARVRAARARRDRARRPARPPVRGQRVPLERAASARRYIAMQEGAGRPPGDRGRAARGRPAPARPRAAARARTAGVGEERRRGRLRRHVHLPHGDRGRAGRGNAGRGARRGLEPARQIYVVRAEGRAPTRAARRVPRVRPARARDRPLGPRRAPRRARRARQRAAAADHERALARRSTSPSPRASTASQSHAERDGVEAADRAGRGRGRLVALGGGSAIDTGKAVSAATGLPLVSVPTTYAGAEWTPLFGMRDAERRMKGGGGGRPPRGDRLRAGADAGPAARRDRRDGDERARALRRGAVRAQTATTRPTGMRSRARR